MDNVIMLFACLAVGMALRWGKRVPDNAHTSINAFIIHVSLPAVTLLQVHSVVFDPALLYAALMPWLLFAASAVLFWAVGRLLRLPRTTIGALAVVGGLGNTSFMGLPMIEAFYGPGGMPTGIVVDQLGTYLVLSTVRACKIVGWSHRAASRLISPPSFREQRTQPDHVSTPRFCMLPIASGPFSRCPTMDTAAARATSRASLALALPVLAVKEPPLWLPTLKQIVAPLSSLTVAMVSSAMALPDRS